MLKPGISILITLAVPTFGSSQAGTKPAKELIEVRAVVTDRQGKPVDGLAADDFLLKEDTFQPALESFSIGKVESDPGRQPSLKMEPVTGTGSAASRNTAAPASPRAVVLLVDTPGISPGGMESVRAALLRFVDEQLTHQDLVALMTTAGKPGVTGEFAGDRTGLRDGIRKLRSGRARTESFLTPALCGKVSRRDPEAVRLATRIIEAEEYTAGSVVMGGGGDTQIEAASKCMMLLLETATRRRAVTSSIRAATGRLAAVAGQRIIALFSEGFSMIAPGGEFAIADVRPAMSAAARSGVMIYCFDATVVLDTKPIDMGNLHLSSEMNNAVRDLQHGIALLANQTGGEAFFSVDSLGNCLQKMLDDNRIYYRFAYSPPEARAPQAYRSITVSVKNHPEYRVRAQKGYVFADLRRSR